MDKQALYNQKEYPFFNQAVLKFIRSKDRVLDIGCSDGKMGMELKNRGCEVWGIDISSKSVKIARTRLNKAFCFDIESDRLAQLPKKYFDVIVFSDVLEHLYAPEEVLVKYKKLLKKGGRIIVSIPNVAFWQIRLHLLIGKFEYQNLSILDPTHLRFFTAKTAEAMFSKSGLRIIYTDSSRIGWRGFITSLWPTFLAGQFVFVLVDVLVAPLTLGQGNGLQDTLR